MSQIAILQSERRSKKQESMEIAVQVSRRVDNIRRLLASPLLKIQDMQLALVQQLAEEAEAYQTRYLDILRDIEMLDRELGV